MNDLNKENLYKYDFDKIEVKKIIKAIKSKVGIESGYLKSYMKISYEYSHGFDLTYDKFMAFWSRSHDPQAANFTIDNLTSLLFKLINYNFYDEELILSPEENTSLIKLNKEYDLYLDVISMKQN